MCLLCLFNFNWNESVGKNHAKPWVERAICAGPAFILQFYIPLTFLQSMIELDLCVPLSVYWALAFFSFNIWIDWQKIKIEDIVDAVWLDFSMIWTCLCWQKKLHVTENIIYFWYIEFFLGQIGTCDILPPSLIIISFYLIFIHQEN